MQSKVFLTLKCQFYIYSACENSQNDGLVLPLRCLLKKILNHALWKGAHTSSWFSNRRVFTLSQKTAWCFKVIWLCRQLKSVASSWHRKNHGSFSPGRSDPDPKQELRMLANLSWEAWRSTISGCNALTKGAEDSHAPSLLKHTKTTKSYLIQGFLFLVHSQPML